MGRYKQPTLEETVRPRMGYQRNEIKGPAAPAVVLSDLPGLPSMPVVAACFWVRAWTRADQLHREISKLREN